MKTLLSLFFLLFTTLGFGQNLSYQGVSYFNEDPESKIKSENYYSHNGLIKVFENDKKITTNAGVYFINSKEIENGVVIYHCTGKDILMNEIAVRVEYDRVFQRVKICPDDEMAKHNYSLYFLVKKWRPSLSLFSPEQFIFFYLCFL